MNDLEFIVHTSQKFEDFLRKYFGAKGNGLGGYAKSLEHLLPITLIKELLYISRVRNDLLHQNKWTQTRDKFEKRCNDVERDLIMIASLYSRVVSLQTRLGELESKNYNNQQIPFIYNNSSIQSNYSHKTKSRNLVPSCPNCDAPIGYNISNVCEFCSSQLR